MGHWLLDTFSLCHKEGPEQKKKEQILLVFVYVMFYTIR